jgi:glycerate kinase
MPAGSSPVVVVAPSSFKGSLEADEVCAAVARGLARVWPDVEVRARPMADGGEGTVKAILSAGGEPRRFEVSGAAGTRRAAAVGIITTPEGPTAVLEAAEVVGITEPDGMAVPVTERSSVGLGELVRELLDAGFRRFLVGLGGSSTNDGGAGLLVGLGARLLDGDGRALAATPAQLARVARVDVGALDERLATATFTILSDVDSPLCGPSGATFVFGPQKGVIPAQLTTLDAAIAHYAAVAEAAFGRRVSTERGAGAAGGLGFALQLLGGRVESGAEVVAQVLGLDEALADADWAITGEGRSDEQTLLGKTPAVVASHARRAGVPVTLLSGAVDGRALAGLNGVFAGCFTLPSGPMSLAECIATAPALLADRSEQLGRLWKAASELRPRAGKSRG